MMGLLAGKWVAQAIGVAAELGIADLLKSGARTSKAIAEAVNASEDGIYRLLRALASIGLFAESAQRRFRLTSLGKLLCSDGPNSCAGYAALGVHDVTWRPWGELRHSVRTGEPAFDRIFGMSAFDYLAQSSDAARVFDRAMTSISTFESRAVVRAYDFSKIGTLVDIAGGHGLLLGTILAANRRLRGILFDLPHVTAGAPAVLEGLGVAGRYEIVSGDFFTSVPEGGDAYVLKHIVHDWDDERAARLLGNCHRAMRPGARLLIVDASILPGNHPHLGKLLDLEMLVMSPKGRERSAAEFGTLLRQAGFRLRRIVPTETLVSVIESVRV
jgi:hypothetical protein